MTPSEQVLQHFTFDHLPEGPMRTISSIMANHARYLDAVLPDGPEKTVGLRKMLEAKDCMVRAAKELPEGHQIPFEVTVTRG